MGMLFSTFTLSIFLAGVGIGLMLTGMLLRTGAFPLRKVHWLAVFGFLLFMGASGFASWRAATPPPETWSTQIGKQWEDTHDAAKRRVEGWRRFWPW